MLAVARGHEVINLDALTYAACLENVASVSASPLYSFEQADIRDLPALEAIFHKHQPDAVMHLAAESHVDRSIAQPVPFIENNVALVLNMLEYARKVKPRAFIQVSTDEVYGSAPPDYSNLEWDSIMPSNPYAASKAAQEAIAISYWRTYGVPVVITNTMNNFGENQNKEKFIPLVVEKILTGEPLSVHGTFKGEKFVSGSRVWLHAENHAHALVHIVNNCRIHSFADGDHFPLRLHVSGEEDLTNLEIVKRASKILGLSANLVLEDYHGSRPGHDLRYSLDGSTLRHEHEWVPPRSFEDSFEATVLSLAKSHWDSQ